MDIDQLIEAFNAEGIDRNQTTRDWYAARIKRYLAFLQAEQIPLHLSDVATVKRYLASLSQEGFSWSTRNGSHTALQQFYKWLVARGYVEVNPFDVEEIKRPRKPRRIKIPLQLASVQAILDTIKADDRLQATRDYALILLMVDSGLRRMEVANLDIRNVNLATGHIAIMVAKQDNQRWAYIKRPTIAAIKAWLDLHPTANQSSPLFVSLNGNSKHSRLNPRSINGLLKSWSEKAGLPDHVKPHDLRRFFASVFSETGGGSKILQEILGHENLETTEGYIITTDDQIRKQHGQHSPINLLTL